MLFRLFTSFFNHHLKVIDHITSVNIIKDLLAFFHYMGKNEYHLYFVILSC